MVPILTLNLKDLLVLLVGVCSMKSVFFLLLHILNRYHRLQIHLLRRMAYDGSSVLN
jgi:hypothetical protein